MIRFKVFPQYFCSMAFITIDLLAVCHFIANFFPQLTLIFFLILSCPTIHFDMFGILYLVFLGLYSINRSQDHFNFGNILLESSKLLFFHAF